MDGMAFVRKTIASAMLWMLAGLMPLQPVLALDCSCQCQSVAAVEQAGRSAAIEPAPTAGCCSCCTKNKPVESSEAEQKDSSPGRRQWQSKVVQPLLGLLPCRCADDCECQLSHEVRPGIVECISPTAEFDAQLCVAIASFETAAFIECAASPDRRYFHGRAPSGGSALDVCAHLCRFTI